MERILVTGGAGFIGSHTCKALAASGLHPIAFDNLSRGHRAARWVHLAARQVRQSMQRANDRLIDEVLPPGAARWTASFAAV